MVNLDHFRIMELSSERVCSITSSQTLYQSIHCISPGKMQAIWSQMSVNCVTYQKTNPHIRPQVHIQFGNACMRHPGHERQELNQALM